MTDPGIIPREPKKARYVPRIISRVLEDGSTIRMRHCDTCHIYRPPRCHHCSDCGNCVEVFDHHCPWIGNCVARRNYRYFISFLVCTSAMLVFVFASSLHLFLLLRSDLGSTGAAGESPITLVLMVYCGLIFLPVSCLTGYHGVIISSGETTKEEVKRLFKDEENPYDRGCLSNWYITLCFSPPPSKLTKLRDLVLPTYLDDDLPPEEREESPLENAVPGVPEAYDNVEVQENTEAYDNDNVPDVEETTATTSYPPVEERSEEGFADVQTPGEEMGHLVEVVTMTGAAAVGDSDTAQSV